MQDREDLPPIKFADLADALLKGADRLVPAWLPGGEIVGHEYKCASLAGGKGGSCSINLNTGMWGDFQSGESGRDLLDLYAQIHGLGLAKAAIQVAQEEGLEDVAGLVKYGSRAGKSASVPNPRPQPEQSPKRERESEWSTLQPVPDYAPAPTFTHYHRTASDLVHTAEYRLGGDLHGYVARFLTSDGGKDTLPYTFCLSAKDGASKWHWRQWDEPRPLYLPSHRLPEGRTVILVEGEIKGEVLQRLLDSISPGIYCVASWPGGSKAWKRADWSWLAGSTVLLWPDCDAKHVPLTPAERKSVKGDDEAREALESSKSLLPEPKQPGMAAMLGIGKLLRDTHGCTVSMLPIPKPGDVKDGWDARDAIEADGWDGETVLQFFGQAQPFIEAATSEPGEPAAPVRSAKAPVGTGGGGDAPPGGGTGFDEPLDDDGPMVRIGSKMVPEWMSYYYDAEKSRWNVSRKLVIACLERLPELRDVLGYDELRNTVQCRKAWPWPYARAGEVRNADALLLGKWLTDTYGLPSISKAALDEGLLTVASTRRFHPIREYLAGLTWDGKPRLSKWLIHALGETPDTLRPAMFEYLGLVSKYWVLGMVYRVMEPGCKYDYCPVLEGAGGLRKSTLVEVLASSEFYSDTAFEVGRGKEAQEQVQGIWVYEIAELSHFSKAEVGAIKAFISAKVDRYRVAYGTTVESFPRQCVLVGTTNEDTYLRDRTGNRRFWPVPVRHRINTDWVAEKREQLLAEAFALYLQGEAYIPSPEQEERLFKPMQDSRLVETAVESELLHVLTRPSQSAGIGALVNHATDFVTMSQLVQALAVDAAKAPPGLQTQITGWLKHEGWERVKKQVHGVRAWGFARPRNWPPEDRPSGLDTPAPADESAPAAPVVPAVYRAAPVPPAPASEPAPWDVDEPF
ncbi:VapE domain-containing protein [Delftia sp. DT-2]|uniref:VapE domain-containing protein n=1 Tax=Delftia sp. DT-2 TaxID=3022772 RepID=UPI00062D5198|nr:VapE domain-containing protein [Delftia sp. DT-2]MDC2858670.1 VapE family protein [Delftia sp. DT-2]